ADLWTPILQVLRGHGASQRRLERHETNLRNEPDSADDASEMEDREQREALWAWEDSMLRLLPADQRSALEWHVMDEMNDATIAASLGVPVNRVRVLRHRASAKCRRFVASGQISPPPGAPPRNAPKTATSQRSATCPVIITDGL